MCILNVCVCTPRPGAIYHEMVMLGCLTNDSFPKPYTLQPILITSSLNILNLLQIKKNVGLIRVKRCMGDSSEKGVKDYKT